MQVLTKIGQFFRLLDENGQLSLTNLSLYVALYRLITTPSASFTEVGTFLLAAAAYNYKKYVAANSPVDADPTAAVESSTEQVANDIEELKSKVSALLIGKSLGK